MEIHISDIAEFHTSHLRKEIDYENMDMNMDMDSSPVLSISAIPDVVIDSETQDFHTCPNADVTACEYCKLVNSLVILTRTFRMRDDLDFIKVLDECITSIETTRHFIDKLTPHFPRFDFSKEVQYNGYRTFRDLAEISVRKCGYIVDDIIRLGRSYSKETHVVLYEKLIDWTRILRLLSVVTECLFEFAVSAKTSCLFTSNREALAKLLSFSKERANVVGFHGRLLGYQFAKSVRAPIRLIGCMMAAFSHVYNTNSIFKHTIVCPPDFVNYWRKPCHRAERIASVCEQDPLDFFMNFWRVQERGLLRIVSNCLGDPVETNLEISIPPTKLQVETTSGGTITILPPTEYLGIKPIMVRLISHKVRHGSVGSGHHGGRSPTRLYGGKVEGISKSLIIHCHGGGFVAQSSNSHLVYLKHWARGLGVPILSVDYSLAPEAPYPRALHECFYAYLWAIKHAHLLGSTAEKIVVVGDSAGGLLLTGVILLCIELGLRVPDGALLVYSPALMCPSVTPGRLLALADPLIPYPALAACLGAYLGKRFDPDLAKLPGAFVEGGWEPEDANIENCVRKFETLELEELEGVIIPTDDYHLSPLMTPDAILKKFPTTSIATCNFDPCLDDCIEFAKRLRDLDVPVTFDVEQGIPHGYLNFGKISDECFQGTNTCLRRLKSLLGLH